jgi:hypothetical protein
LINIISCNCRNWNITRDNIDQLLYTIADKLEEVKDIDFSVEEDEDAGYVYIIRD